MPRQDQRSTPTRQDDRVQEIARRQDRGGFATGNRAYSETRYPLNACFTYRQFANCNGEPVLEQFDLWHDRTYDGMHPLA